MGAPASFRLLRHTETLLQPYTLYPTLSIQDLPDSILPILPIFHTADLKAAS